MGQENGRDEERPVHRVIVAPFRLCRFQVTNEHYSLLHQLPIQPSANLSVAQWGRPPGLPPESGREAGSATLPATSVNWFDALDYCRRLSREWNQPIRLPTEAEWEFAARGGLEQKLYPWGDAPPESRPDYAARWRSGPEPVATSEPNGYGLYDMCENVHEWCSDWFDPAYYAASPAENPPGPVSGTRRASRGGAWRHHIKIARCAARSSIPPEFRYADYGFRIAADA